MYRDLAFKDNINAHVKDDIEVSNAIDRLIFENEFDSLLSEMAITVASKSEAVFKNYLDEGQSKITYIQPEYYFPEFDPYNQRKIIRETIAFPVVENNQTFLHQEVYEKRSDGYYWCITKKNEFNDNEIGTEIENDEVNTYLTQSPLTHVPFSRHNSDFFGYSIFFGIEPLLEEYNWRVSQISKILDKFSNPNIIGDETLLDETRKFKVNENGIFIPVNKDEIEPKYLVWDSQLKANFEYINEIIMKALHYVSPLNPSLYGVSKEASNASSRAIKLKAWRTQNIVENSLIYWRRAIQKVLYLAQQLEVISGKASYEPKVPNVEIYASMPKDSYEMVQEEQLKVVTGLTSIKSAIARINPHYNSQQVEDEWLEIINEKMEEDNMRFVER